MRVATYVPVTKRLGLALSCSDGDDETHGETGEVPGVKLASAAGSGARSLTDSSVPIRPGRNSHSLGHQTLVLPSKYTSMGMSLRLMCVFWIRATINANMLGSALFLGLTATPLSCPQSQLSPPFSISSRLVT
jgi:hypothetical protein